MSEASAWTTLKSHLMGPGVHIQRFEDKLTGGIPDTNVCIDGVEVWLEGKFLKTLPKRATTLIKVGLRADQALWLETRQRAGGKAYVWIRVADRGWMLFEDRFRDLQNGMVSEEFFKAPVYPTCKAMVSALKVFMISETINV